MTNLPPPDEQALQRMSLEELEAISPMHRMCLDILKKVSIRLHGQTEGEEDYRQHLISSILHAPDSDPYESKEPWVLAEPMNGLRKIVQCHAPAPQAWEDMLALCRRIAPSPLWDALPPPDFSRDIASAHDWLKRELDDMPTVTGVYLGLDTLNMRDGEGKNLEIGTTDQCDPVSDSLDWLTVDQLSSYGDDHLIRGLYELANEYKKPCWKKPIPELDGYTYSWLAEFFLFFGYSGMILAHAWKQLETRHTMLVCWGFHDGDPFLLGRKTSEDFILL